MGTTGHEGGWTAAADGHAGDKARVLTYVLSVIILFCLASALILPLIEPVQSRRALAFALIPPPAIVALYLAHVGRLALAARWAVFGIWGALTLGIALHGGLQEPLALAYPLLILIAGMSLGLASVLWLTGLTLVALSLLLVAQQAGMLEPVPPASPAWMLTRAVLASLAAAALASRLLVGLRGKVSALLQRGDELARRLGEVEAREAVLNLVMENVPAMIHYADRDFLCLLANQPFRTFFGLGEKVGLGGGLSDLVGAENLARLRPHALGALEGRTVALRSEFVGSTGARRIFDCSFVPDRSPDGTVRGYFGQMVDVTEHQEAEAELRRSEDKFSRIFHASPIPIALLTEDGRLLEVNDALCRESGWKREQLLGRTTVEMGLWPSPQDREDWKEKLVRNGHYQGQELRLIDAAGQPHWVLVSSEMLPLADGPAILSFIVDMTGRKRAEEAIAQANAHLERRVKSRTAELTAANKELESFAYSVSHDLRTPLRSLDGFSHILLTDYGDKLGEEGRSHLHRIRRSAQRLGILIDELLHLSRVARQELRLDKVDLGRMAREILDDLANSEPSRQVETVVCQDCPCPEGCRAKGDPALLRGVMENLLGNAWKYTSKSEGVRIEFGCRADGERQRYFVRDNGIGFDMAHAKRLFLPFERMHHASQFEGSGIGLATAARIVRRHGGEIGAQAEPGKGATFSFTLE
ncbi:MAG: PAS domain S-box protein [Rhodocyclaceae bacterium]|nr:PAS domain S-box protein [Rhodocyclaceae bacterium]